jgi:hypothetical protein
MKYSPNAHQTYGARYCITAGLLAGAEIIIE